jgi:threonine dehydrogenase-like Zn-dependent dehydrogenase
MEETAGKGADIVLETAGLPATFIQSIDISRRGGRIIVVAYYEEPVEFKPHVLINKNVKLLPGRGTDWRRAFELIKSGKITDKHVVTHRFPLDKINEAFETAANSSESVKVMIEP